MRHTGFACGLGLHSSWFNFAILRARLAVASLYPCLWHLPAVPSVSTFPLVDAIKRFFV
jgi:hypothetical protein